MTRTMPDTAFILAAGLGSRLRPYTDACPKPLVPVAGRPIIDRILDRLEAAGVRRVTVNLHYRAEQLAAHLRAYGRMEVTLSFEPALLDTGGGVANALPETGGAPFYIVSGDSFWTDGPSGPALGRLAEAWREESTDILLLLQPLPAMILTSGRGDYDLEDGRPLRSRGKTGAYVWTSVRLCSPRAFRDAPPGAFSFLSLLDRAEAEGRLGAIVHDGDWHHITAPDDLERVDAALRSR